MRNLPIAAMLLFALFLISCSTTSSSNNNISRSANASDPNQRQSEKTSFDYMRDGSQAFLSQDYKGAIGPYQKALDLEKADPKLDKSLWLALIDNLAIAYGISGDLKTSRETLDYGISKQPDYPMFYYIMADTYGEQKDEDNAVKYLDMAYKRRDNMIKGEQFPDPLTDDSFRDLVKSERFKKAVHDMDAATKH